MYGVIQWASQTESKEARQEVAAVSQAGGNGKSSQARDKDDHFSGSSDLANTSQDPAVLGSPSPQMHLILEAREKFIRLRVQVGFQQ